MKRLLKLAGVLAFWFVVFIGLYLISAYFLSHISIEAEPVNNHEIEIYILTNGVHTDLILPVKSDQTNWSNLIPFENTISKDSTANWIGFGWGDKGFYLETPTWADLKFSTAFKAAFNLSTSAIHATFHKTMNEGENCKKINLSSEQYSRLITYVRQSFLYDDQGKSIHIQTNANYGGTDAFYEAVGSYNLFHTCNTWANNGLKSCGQKASLWTPFDSGIFYHY